MESPRPKDLKNRSTFKIEKTRTDQSGSKLTEPNWNFFFLPQIRRGNCLVYLNGSYGPENDIKK